MKTTDRSTSGHVPVLLEPVLGGLNIRPQGVYIDGTFGRGGHSREIWKRLGPAGRLLAVDRDPQAVSAADPALMQDPRFEIVRDEIANIRQIADQRSLLGKVDGLLFDLGVSSPQLDDSQRGFSFQANGPLDMRMDPMSGVSAADWIAAVDEKGLKQVLFRFGEERFAARIAKTIVAARQRARISTTSELAHIITSAIPKAGQKSSRRHPATKTFQAIRIQVNEELEQLHRALASSTEVLASGGRLCVISFHSLEDRIVKRFMRSAAREAEAWRGLPSIPAHARPPFKLVGKAITASSAEIAANPRARSARLRIAERS